MRAARCVGVVGSVLLVAGCGQAHKQAHDATRHLTYKDNGRRVTLKPHRSFVLTLPSSPASGNRWEFAPASQAFLGFRLLSHRHVAFKGVGGEDIWRFRPVGHGGAELGFFYGRLLSRPQRHWSIARRFDVGVNVR
jgi:predicted secreted protein